MNYKIYKQMTFEEKEEWNYKYKDKGIRINFAYIFVMLYLTVTIFSLVYTNLHFSNSVDWDNYVKAVDFLMYNSNFFLLLIFADIFSAILFNLFIAINEIKFIMKVKRRIKNGSKE